MRHFIRSAALAVVLLCGAGFAGTPSAEARSVGVPLGGYGYYGAPSWGASYGGHWGGGYRGYRGWRGHDHFAFGFSAPLYYRPYYGSYYEPSYYRPYARPAYRGPIYSLGLFPASVGDTLSYDARGYYYDAYRQALAAPVGQAIEWNSGSAQDTVETTLDGWAGERYCREFRQNVTIDGQTQGATGTACKTPNGDWQLVQNQE